MIISTMTIPEIRREINLDLPYLLRSVEWKLKKLTRVRIKKKLPTIRWYFYVNSPRRTRWLIMVECIKNGEAKIDFIALYKVGSKTRAIWFGNDPKKDLIIYSDHFFHRYAERFAIRVLNIEDIISKFFFANALFVVNRDGGDCSYTFPEGFGLGQFDKENRTYYLNTYVTTEMLYKAQSEIRKFSMKKLKKYVSENYSDDFSFGNCIRKESFDPNSLYRSKQAS